LILLLSILGTIFSLGGNILIILKKRIGWLAWIIGNILWIAENIIGEFNAPMVVMYIVYFFINLAGFIRWKNN
jgi:nicotinamide riboside transporter PnuC